MGMQQTSDLPIENAFLSFLIIKSCTSTCDESANESPEGKTEMWVINSMNYIF